MNLLDAFKSALRQIAYGIGIFPPVPPVSGRQEMIDMRQAERNLRLESLLIRRSLRHDQLAKLEERFRPQ